MEYLAEHAHLEQLARDKNISSTAGAHKIVEARKALELRKAETGRRLDEAIAKLDAGQDLGIPDNIMYESVFHDPHLSGVNKEKVRGLMGSAEVDIPVNFPATLTPRQRELHLTLREVGVDPKEYLRLNRSLRFDNLQGDEFAQWTEMRQKLDRAEIDDKELQEFVELDRGTSLSSMEQFAKNYQNLGEIKRRSAKGS
ncbi:MAG: hypothetical protein GY938_19250, partial [Ketobacter sp.]|nr:hypothetical protein [Ketobacter sp.]